MTDTIGIRNHKGLVAEPELENSPTKVGGVVVVITVENKSDE